MVSFMCEFKNQAEEEKNQLTNYVRKISSYEQLNDKDEKYFINMAQNGDKLAREVVVRSNLRLVISIAKKSIHICKLSLFDLIQEGNLGLMAAIDKFNPKYGCRFATYAAWWVKQAMFKAISEQAYAMKIPVYIQETLSKYKKVKSELEQKYNSDVQNSVVAMEMGIEEEKIDKFLNAYTKALSLETHFESDNENSMSFSEIIEDKSQNTEKEIEQTELKRDIKTALKSLKDKEQEVLSLRFGLDNSEPETLLEIGKKFGVTKECIRQMERRAIQKISSQENLRNLLVCYVA